MCVVKENIMIKALSFSQNPNIAHSFQTNPQGLKPSVALRSQPQLDEVAFRGLTPKKATQTLINCGYHKKTRISDIRPITVFHNPTSKKVTAYLAKTNLQYFDFSREGLAVFSEEGKLLGDIQMLDADEYERIKTVTSPFTGYSYDENVGKYLKLEGINASYTPEYKGVGTALIDAAKEESKKLGFEGQLKVYALNDYPNSTKGSPIPFYTKMGFIAKDFPFWSKEYIIEKYSKKENRAMGLKMFLLTPQNLEALKARAAIR